MNIISKFIFLKETRCCSRGSQRLPQSVLTALRELRVGAIWACIVTEHKGHQEWVIYYCGYCSNLYWQIYKWTVTKVDWKKKKQKYLFTIIFKKHCSGVTSLFLFQNHKAGKVMRSSLFMMGLERSFVHTWSYFRSYSTGLLICWPTNNIIPLP